MRQTATTLLLGLSFTATAYAAMTPTTAVPYGTAGPPTVAPTTAAPTTPAPATPTPTTLPPVTPAPTTAVPVTPAPTTPAPVTPAATTAVPVPTAAPSQTCENYECPAGWHDRAQRDALRCVHATCTDSADDRGNCCLNGSPVTTAAPPVTPAGATAGPLSTCSGFTCPVGWTAKANPQLRSCIAATGCTEADNVNCCTSTGGATVGPTAGPNGITPAPTPAPTPPPLVVPSSCKVVVPPDGFAPWEVYKVMKASTPKIETPRKMEMGGVTMNLTGVTSIRASQFQCENANNELRAVLSTAPGTSPVATISLADPVTPNLVTTQCLLSKISMYKSKSAETWIPGLRFDYHNCPFGVAKQATIMVGLKRVPNNWGPVPGLSNFFKDVCGDNTTTGDAQLRLDLTSTIMAAGGVCFAQSADMTLMTSDQDCFEPALVFTLMDANNHLPLFPVTSAEWDYLVEKIPAPLGDEPTAAPESPCAPAVEPPHPHVYGSIMQNRLCINIPELGCFNNCGKDCVPVKALSIPQGTTAAPCATCYDCHYDEMFYAVGCTILAFILCQSFYKCVTRKTAFNTQWYWSEKIQVPEQPYSMLSQPARAVSRETFHSAITGFFFMSLFFTAIAFLIVNSIDYWIKVTIQEKEMCLKIFSFQDHYRGSGFWWQDAGNACHNNVCPERLLGLFIVVWLSLWALFGYWRYYMTVTAEKISVTRRAATVEFGGGGGGFAHGGSSVVACTVQ